jgi:hypothetical protein
MNPPVSLNQRYRIYLMSKKRLSVIIVWFSTLAATGAIADVTHTPLDAANRGATGPDRWRST